MKTRLLAVGLLLSSALAAAAAPFPLPASAPLNPATELTAPFVLSDGLTQCLITNRVKLTATGLPATFGLWDMSAFDKNSRNVFIPSEVGAGAGVFRYNLNTRTFTTLMVGNGSGVRASNPALFNPLNDDFSRFDPATYTPWNSLLVGEETTGGRLFEVENPGANGNIKVRWLSKVPAVAHEGLRFDNDGNLYFIVEDNSGSIYKYVPSKKKDLASGQTFVLKVAAFTGAAGEVWNSATNTGKIRIGAAT